jgi:hypothetical protein
MSRPWERLERSARDGVAGVLVAVALVVGGCGSPGEGSATVSAESRARLVPHAGPTTKDARGNDIANKPMSAKDVVRRRAAAGPP